MKHSCRVALCTVIGLLLSGCRINEDLEDCVRLHITYRVQLVTNVNVALHEELNANITEQLLADRLRQEFDSIFKDYAEDLDMLFYRDRTELAQHRAVMMNGTDRSFELTVPIADYLHLAVANVGSEPLVALDQESDAATLHLTQQRADTIDSHSTGFYTARTAIDMAAAVDQQEFRVDLYLANAAVAVIIDPQEVDYRDLRVDLHGMASDFAVRDSVFSYAASPVVRARDFQTGSALRCFYAVCFPSRDATSRATSTRAATTRADATRADAPDYWQTAIRVTLADGTTVHSTLHLEAPLRAGDIRVLKARLNDDGSLSVGTEAGASVSLDWKEGGTYNPEI